MEADDNSFGPFFYVPGQSDFDFTLLFEETILSILPSTILLLAAPLRALQLWHSSQKVRVSKLRTIKVTLLFAFAALQIINLIVWSLEPSHRTSASVADAVLLVIVALALLCLSSIEHSRSIRPSFLIGAYLLLTALFDATRVRTLWTRAGTAALSSIASISLALKLSIIFAEAVEKRSILLPPYTHYSPESTSNLYGRLVFWWLNPLFWLGFRNVLQERQLFDTDESLSAASLSKRFHETWDSRKRTSQRYQLLLSMARCMVTPLTAAVIPRLCQTFFHFMQPLLIRKATSYVNLSASDTTASEGWGLTAAYGIVYIGIAISVAMFNYQAYRVAAMIRGALVAAIYSKTLTLSISALDEAAAITLMSTDVQRLADAMPLIHEAWACPLEIGLAVWLLVRELGLAVIGPVIVLVLAVSSVSAVSSRTASAQKDWLAAIQTRVSVTASSLQSMKSVKMLGLTPVVSRTIEDLRISEVTLSLHSRYLMTYSVICGNLANIFAPGSAFTIFVIASHYNRQQLTTSSAYTIMSLVSLLATPTKTLINFVIPQLSVAVGCFDRVQDYLLSESRRDDRLVTSETTRPSYSNTQKSAPTSQVVREAAIELSTLTKSASQSTKLSGHGPTVRIVDCTLTWKSGAKPVIKNVSFDLYPGLNMLIGKVGCGKTSLVKGLLGELQSTKGHIYIEYSHIAFVDQSPWIHQGSLHENVVGMSIFDPIFYSQVLYACALDEDIKNWEQGDDTQVGSTGGNLSGGQKLRVALARAIYSQKQILVLDDVFSGLDKISEERIFSRLLGRKGLLHGRGVTIFLVSHAVHRLPYADKIIALDEDGSIAEQGSFTQLMTDGKYVSKLSMHYTTEDDTRPRDQLEPKVLLESGDGQKAVAEDDLHRPVGDSTVYRYYFGTVGYRYTFAFLFSVASFAFLVQFPGLWLAFWTSAVASRGNHVNGGYLGGMLAFNFAAFLSGLCLLYLANIKMIPRSALRLHERLLNSVKQAPLVFFTSTGTGQIVNRFSQDLNIIDFELPWAIVEFAASSCIALVQAVFICLSAAYFAAVMPVVLAIMYMLQKFYLRTSRQVRLIDLEAKSPLYSNFIETLNGLLTIRAFGWTAEFKERNLKLLDRSQRPLYGFFCIQRWLNLVLDLTVAGLAVLLMVLVVTLRQKLEAGLVGVALLNIMGFNLSLTEVIKQWTTLETSLGAVARVKSFVDETPCECLPAEQEEPLKTWPGLGAGIDLRDVSASYAMEGVEVLRNINLTIPPGQKVGLAGASGSGKSSFVAMLLHTLAIRNGTVAVDNFPMNLTQRELWRRGFNVITQEPLFIYGSIRANLDPFATGITNEQMVAALTRVGLYEIVAQALTDPFDAHLYAEKVFSHGQRQLFCLARALLNRSQDQAEPGILVLDEATASVDIQTDEIMQRIIREEFSGWTIIAVAHRLQTIIDFDRILVLDKGRIVEDGPPQGLLARDDSRFRKLWDSS